MRHRKSHQVRTAIGCLLLLGAGALRCACGQIPRGFVSAAAAFDRSDFPQAERLLREALTHAPNNIFALNLLAVSLDRQEKYTEAETVYARALRLDRNATLLNNFANHWLARGEREKARKYFQETLRLDPRHSNAHYQLAVLDVGERRPAEALRHIQVLPGDEQKQPAVLLVKAQALIQSGQADDAKTTTAPLEAVLSTNPAVAFSLGAMYYQEKLYAEAVRAFEAALRLAPGNFEVLYNLGLAYYRNGDKERSAEVLQRAVHLNGKSADAFYHLAVVLDDLGRHDAAIEFLVRAREVAPEKPEVSLFLARACGQQQFWLDSSEAFEAYLRLKPDDWDVRKELALVYGRLRYFDQAREQMDRYAAARPSDGEGLYLRGLINWHLKRAAAAEEDFKRTLALDPRKAEAWARLGEIAREKNEIDEAERCYRRALEIQPDETNALYGLGQIFNTREQFYEAVPLLEKAVQTRQDEPAPHYQLSLAYRRLGKEDLARAEMEKFQRLRKQSQEGRFLRTGLVSYLREGMKLTERERQARELEYLERAANIKTGDFVILGRLLDAYLTAGKKPQADETIQKWVLTDSNGAASLRVGQILAHHGDYEAAITYFQQAAKYEGQRYAAQVGLAEAQFQLGKYAAALDLLSPLKPAPSDASFHTLRGAILDKLQRFDEALAAYQQAIRADPRRESSYLELGQFFVSHLAYDAALENYRAAQKALPESLRLALSEAIALNLNGHREESYNRLVKIEKRWPEQDLPYILAGISAFTAYRFPDARREFETAAAAESTNPLTYYYLALLESQSAQANSAEALRWAELAVDGDPGFSQARYLLGKICKTLGKTAEARQNLEEAVRLQPNLAEAHYLLGRIYAEAGDTVRAEAETRESIRWHTEVHQVSPEKENILRLLVRVEPAGR